MPYCNQFLPEDPMDGPHRSGCPINLALEVFGDRWSLIVLRDIIFGGRRHFRDLLRNSEEGIASNILADRLRRLTALGLITQAADPGHKQRTILSLTEMSIALVPVLAQLGGWGSRFLPVSPALSIRARLLEAGGPPMWERFMAELRAAHLGIPASHDGPTVAEALRAAYEAELAKAGAA
jgi:DNA-binding HxlR family transcriptional regulator